MHIACKIPSNTSACICQIMWKCIARRYILLPWLQGSNFVHFWNFWPAKTSTAPSLTSQMAKSKSWVKLLNRGFIFYLNGPKSGGSPVHQPDTADHAGNNHHTQDDGSSSSWGTTRGCDGKQMTQMSKHLNQWVTLISVSFTHPAPRWHERLPWRDWHHWSRRHWDRKRRSHWRTGEGPFGSQERVRPRCRQYPLAWYSQHPKWLCRPHLVNYGEDHWIQESSTMWCIKHLIFAEAALLSERCQVNNDNNMIEWVRFCRHFLSRVWKSSQSDAYTMRPNAVDLMLFHD